MTKYCRNLIMEKPLMFNVKKFSRTLLICGVGLYLAIIVGAYLSEMNYLTTKGFYARNLEKQIAQIQNENEKLQSQAIEMKSMNDLLEKIQGLAMVKVDEITYFDTTGQTVARR